MTTTVSQLTGDYTLDTTHTRLGFVARHAMVTKVRGAFTEFSGTAHLDAEDPTRSSAQLTIQVASIDTGNDQRDEHLRTNDFFEVATYPEITFVSTSAESLGDDQYRLTGDLTIKGTTKPVSVDFEYTGTAVDPFGNTRVGFEGKTVLNRKDWGIAWNAALDTGGVLVSEKITLEFDVSAVKNA
ncbi:YceI family protein [Sporichthya polymorpha]|uniref:YceI family protein n=1 Tax=Sporichthya polymorpha TaxID=35751 RepID=UPI00036FAADE|nr:YceI family protein [Sporichthya polymorpha]